MRHRRQVLGAVLACNLIGQGWANVALLGRYPAYILVELALYYALLVAGIATANKRANIAILAGLIAIYVFTAVMSFL